MSDFQLMNHGSVLVLTPLTKPAEEFVANSLDGPETQHWGKGVVIEPRYWPDIQVGIQDEGMTVMEC
jgi:hypothetical protein